jgi:uncharacterized protein
LSTFIGTGWAFPPRTDGRGGIALVSDMENIERAIWVILSTPIGQRVMRPTFGSRLHELVFAPLDAQTFGLAETYTEEALTFWEPRIEVLDVLADTAPTQAHVLSINITYRVKATHDERSLVYPFYQLPGE